MRGPGMCWACVAVLQLLLLLCCAGAVHGADPVPVMTGLQPQLLTVPPGFNISVYHAGVPKARTMSATAVNGSTIVYVGSVGPGSGNNTGNVYYIVDEDSDGVPDFNGTLLEADTPNGVVVQGSDLLVSGFEDGKGMVWRLRDVHGYALRNQRFTGNRSVVTDRLPGDRWHGRRVLRFSPDGLLVLAVGVPCNACRLNRTAQGVQFGALYALNTTSGELRQLATGVRNSVGFDWHPQTGELYFTDNGRDRMGDNRPDCEFNRIPVDSPTVVVRPNGTTPPSIPDFGHPFCHTQGLGDPYVRDFGGGVPLPDPEFNPNGRVVNCSDPGVNLQPAQALGPHTAPLGMRFYRWRNVSGAFPRAYDATAFVAEHGSWDRAAKIGHRVMMVRLDNASVAAYEPFASGWLQNENVAEHNFTWGRPVDVEQLPDGSMLISDDGNGALYRVTYDDAAGGDFTGSDATGSDADRPAPRDSSRLVEATGGNATSGTAAAWLGAWAAALACAAAAALALVA
ncbi:hypothetical protein COO60DRAFT_1702581 [Scenedesmus sp. NREL 46B-D3]|nr:hypothetical protein COO60DRAFT_1702581 [Scenedesmus sp. NREL 46B-D3]